jgi:hypothetical protein
MLGKGYFQGVSRFDGNPLYGAALQKVAYSQPFSSIHSRHTNVSFFQKIFLSKSGSEGVNLSRIAKEVCAMVCQATT